MRPRKTELAHVALRDRPVEVNAFERRVLILSDGRRALRDLVSLLGDDAAVALRRLLRDGYLEDADARRHGAAAAIDSVARTRDEVSRGAHGVQTVVATAPTTAAAASRRSLVAAKIYVLDMLQLQRGAETAAVAAALRATREPDDVVARLLHALAHLHATTNPSYARRVAERLGEALPDAHLPQFTAFRDALFDRAEAAA